MRRGLPRSAGRRHTWNGTTARLHCSGERGLGILACHASGCHHRTLAHRACRPRLPGRPAGGAGEAEAARSGLRCAAPPSSEARVPPSRCPRYTASPRRLTRQGDAVRTPQMIENSTLSRVPAFGGDRYALHRRSVSAVIHGTVQVWLAGRNMRTLVATIPTRGTGQCRRVDLPPARSSLHRETVVTTIAGGACARGATLMSRLRVNAFGISIDGYGAGPDQALDNPMGVGGMALHQWVFGT